MAAGRVQPCLRALGNVLRERTGVPAVLQIQKRWSRYTSSPMYKDPSHYTDYEVTRNPEEWKYVERMLTGKIIPKPPLDVKETPSGWKPPTAKPHDYPYYIQRTKNYMLPVYLERSFRGMRRITILSKIHGDIWQLETDLKKYLEKETRKEVGIKVHELVGQMKFRADVVTLVKNWLIAKGF